MKSIASLLVVAAVCVAGSTAPHAQSVPATTTGVVYLRSDTLAYPPNYVPSAGLPGAAISLAGNSTVTNAVGTFSIPSSTVPTSNYVPLTASHPGYVPTSYPWVPDDAKQPIGIGFYPEVTAVPRPGFVGGIIPIDAGGWLQLLYDEGNFPPTFDRIKNVAGANMVVFVDPIYVTSYNTATNIVTMDRGLPNGWPEVPRPMYDDMAALAKSRGLQLMLLIGLERLSPQNYVGGDVNAIPTTNAQFWDAWFAAYEPLVLRQTAIARDLGIQYVGLGFNLGYMSRLGAERWRALIDAMRAIGYTGKITYFGLSSGAFADTEIHHEWSPETGPNDPVGFMRLFDAIGIDIYDAVTKTTSDEVLDRAQTRVRIRSGLKALFDRVSEAPVPVFAMIGTPSVHGGVSYGEFIEPCIDPGCNSLAPSRTRDLQQQADLYQAACEVINESPTGNGRVMGLFSWGYHFKDNYVRVGNDHDNAAFDKTANIRGKPAEAVLRWWFDRWTTGTRPERAAPPAIVGAWTTCGDAVQCSSVLVFLENGTYYHIEDATAAQGPSGFERGTYTWNPDTGEFTITTLDDTNGNLGLSRFSGTPGLTFTVAGNGATLATAARKSTVVAARVTQPNPIGGGWIGDEVGASGGWSVVVFLADGTYLAMQRGTTDGTGTTGIEHGNYGWDPQQRVAIVNSPPAIDTNGNWGLSPHPQQSIRPSSDLFSITLADGLRVSAATRVGPVPDTSPPNYQGLWWNSPAGSESGWGINFAHQGDTVFATWFTYDKNGKPLWMAASAQRSAPGVYTGDLFITTGPSFSAAPFNPANVVETPVGTATFTFTDVDNGTFGYTVNSAALASGIVAQTKNITRQVFAASAPTCVWAAQPNLAQATNYQDLWWKSPASSESGWGINLTHQGDTIFATWFTYDATGNPWWLAFVADKTEPGVYAGNVFTTTGPAFNAVPFNSGNVVETTVGTTTLTFIDGNNATFAYTVNGVTQSKLITRQVFAAPGTLCSSE